MTEHDEPSDDDRDDDDPDDEPAPPAPAARASNDVAAAPARAPMPRGPRRNLGATATQGAWAPWTNTDALPLWMEILTRQLQYPELGSAYDIEIRVRRVSPTTMPFQAFGGEVVMGSEQQSGADALLEYVTDQCHLPTARGRAIYDVVFQWRKSARNVTGRLELPSADEIIAVRNANQQRPPPRSRQGAGGYAGGSSYGTSGYAGPAGPSPAPSSGYGPPYAHDAYMQRQISELVALRGTLEEALAAAREGRAANLHAPPPPAPPGPPASVEEAVDRALARALPTLVQTIAGSLGLTPRPAAGAAVAAASGLPRPPADPIRHMADNFAHDMVEAALSQVAKSVKSALSGVPREGGAGLGAPPPEPAVEVMAEPVPAERPEDKLPFEATPIGDAKWSDGRPVMYTRSRETGDIDWGGALFGNPYVAEKVVDAVGKIGEAVQSAVNRLAGLEANKNAAAQVVREIPHDAVPAGVGYPPPPEPERRAPPPPAAPPNGEAKSGWPQV